MLGWGAGHSPLAVALANGFFLPPVELSNIGDALVLEPALEAQWDKPGRGQDERGILATASASKKRSLERLKKTRGNSYHGTRFCI